METERRAWKLFDEFMAPGPITIVFILFFGLIALGVKVFAPAQTEEPQKTSISEKAGEKTKNIAKDFFKGLTK